MSEQELIILSDDQGNELECEVLDFIRYNDKDYAILYPVNQDQDEGEVIILEVVAGEDGQEDFLPVEAEDLLDEIFDAYMEAAQEDDETDA